MRPDPKDTEAALTLSSMRLGYRLQAPHPGLGFTHLPKPSILDHTPRRQAQLRAAQLSAGLFATSKPSKPTKTTSSRITYVNFHKGNKKWNASISLGQKKCCLGYFITQEEAGRHLLDVLNTLRDPATNITKAALEYASKIAATTTITPHDDLDMKIARLESQLYAISVLEGSSHKLGF